MSSGCARISYQEKIDLGQHGVESPPGLKDYSDVGLSANTPGPDVLTHPSHIRHHHQWSLLKIATSLNSNVCLHFFTFALMITTAFSQNVGKLFSELKLVTITFSSSLLTAAEWFTANGIITGMIGTTGGR